MKLDVGLWLLGGMIIALVGSQFAVWARLGEIAGHAYRAMGPQNAPGAAYKGATVGSRHPCHRPSANPNRRLPRRGCATYLGNEWLRNLHKNKGPRKAPWEVHPTEVTQHRVLAELGKLG